MNQSDESQSTTTTTKDRFMEVLTSINQLDLIIKKLFLEVEASSSSSSFLQEYNIYTIILEAKASKIMQLSKTELRILDLFAEHKAMTLDEIRCRLKFNSNRWPLDKCKRLQECGFIVCTLRKHQDQGRPFSIYHVHTATHSELDRAEAVYLKLKTSHTPKKEVVKDEEEMCSESKNYWKCQTCKIIYKQFEKPAICDCGQNLFSRYVVDPLTLAAGRRNTISKKIIIG